MPKRKKPEAKIISDETGFYAQLPLTEHTGKVRVKRRSHFTDYGLPVTTRSKALSQADYIEWQIGYDLLANEENKSKTSLSGLIFTNNKGECKYPYELAEILYFAKEKGLISDLDVKTVFEKIIDIEDASLFDSTPEMLIKRTQPVEKTLNGMDFIAMDVCYPLLVRRFGAYDVYAEIITREKQYAIGVQPMLYVCVPLCLLKYAEPHFGRCVEKDEIATWNIGADEAKMALEILHIFGMLSSRHKHDVISILRTLFPNSIIQ